MSNQNPQTIFAKINEISQRVKYLQKRGRNSHHGYNYVTEADVLAAVRQAMNDVGLVLTPTISSVEQNGKLTTIHMQMVFGDCDTGDVWICAWAGIGQDSGDKGIWKAITGAQKYFLMKTFLIPSGDDPERWNPETEDDEEDTPEPAAKQSIDRSKQAIYVNTVKTALGDYHSQLPSDVVDAILGQSLAEVGENDWEEITDRPTQIAFYKNLIANLQSEIQNQAK